MKYLVCTAFSVVAIGCNKSVPLRGDLEIVKDQVYVESSEEITFNGRIAIRFVNDNNFAMVIDRFVKAELVTTSSGKKIYSPFWPSASKSSFLNIEPRSSETIWIPFSGHLKKSTPLVVSAECVVDGKPVTIEVRERKN